MRAIASLSALLFVAAACAPPASLPPVQTPTRVVDRVGSEQYHAEIERTRDYSSLAATIEHPADATFRALVETYETLGLSAEMLNLEERLVGNAQLRLRRSLDGVRLSRYFDCGRSATGAMADSYQLTLDVRSQVAHDGVDRSRLVTWIRARAISPGQAADMSLACASTGGLEGRIAAAVRARLGG